MLSVLTFYMLTVHDEEVGRPSFWHDKDLELVLHSELTTECVTVFQIMT